MKWFLHAEEIKLYNLLKFHKISSSGMAIIMGQKCAKIPILYFADLREVKIPYIKKKKIGFLRIFYIW